LIRNINNIHGIIFIKFLVALSGYIFFYYNAFSLVDIGIGGGYTTSTLNTIIKTLINSQYSY
ncbi:hypothetical protein, partial [Salmonella enterica]|uniref:hypothetical protein n=1 Tax=Salmonella enterica TaxID=28901 RepID=UPI00265C4859